MFSFTMLTFIMIGVKEKNKLNWPRRTGGQNVAP